MGYYKDSRGITTYTPDDTPDMLYIESYGHSFKDIRDRMCEHFGEQMNMDDFSIQAEKIHTHCIGYDLYDPGDYTNYLCITRIPT